MTNLTWEAIEKFQQEIYTIRPDLKDKPCVMVSLPYDIEEGVELVFTEIPGTRLVLKTHLRLLSGEVFAIDLQAGEIVAVKRNNAVQEVL